MAETNEALAAAGLNVKADQKVRHMVEVLIEDFGYEALGSHVKKPLEDYGSASANGPSLRITSASASRPTCSGSCGTTCWKSSYNFV